MRYKINNIRHERHESDDDTIYFYFGVQFSEPEELYIKEYFLPYSTLLVFIRDKYPDFYQYIEQTRRSIDGFGPCEARTMEAIGEDAVQRIYVCLEEYLSGCGWLEELFYHYKKLQNKTPEEQIKYQQDAEKAYKELSEMDSGMRESQNRYRNFCETVTKEIRKTATDIFPEIAELEPEQLKEFKYLFVSDIQSMHEKIEKLLAEKK